MPKICEKVGCTQLAAYSVHLELHASASTPGALTSALVCVCEMHKDVKWNDVVGEEGWAQIVNSFLSIGKARPQQKYSTVKLVPLAKEQ